MEDRVRKWGERSLAAVERQQWLDRPSYRLEHALTFGFAALGGARERISNLLHGTWLGHPVHPILVQVPVGSWTSAGLLDAIPRLRPAATVLIGTGVAVSVPAALSGAADWSEQGIGVRRLGLLHAAGNTVALGLYIGSLVARARGRGGLGRVLSYACLLYTSPSPRD